MYNDMFPNGTNVELASMFLNIITDIHKYYTERMETL